MKKIVTLLAVLLIFVSFNSIEAETKEEPVFEEIESLDDFFYNGEYYHLDKYNLDGEIQIVILNDSHLYAFDENWNQTGYQDLTIHMNVVRMIPTETLDDFSIKKSSIKMVAPTMYNNWGNWYQVTNSSMSFNLVNFASAYSLASAMFSCENSKGIKSAFQTWMTISTTWISFLGTNTIKTTSLYRRTNLDCRIVVKESALATSSARDANYNVTWLENPWVYTDEYPYACRYLWDKDL